MQTEKTRIKEAVIFVGGRNERMQSEPYTAFLPKTALPLTLTPRPEAIFERLVNHLKELEIENIYLLTDSEDEQERFSKYIKKKNWEGVYCFYIKEQGTGNTLLSFKEENKDKLKENFLIIAGDSIFEKKEEEVKEVFKNFIEEGKKLIQNKNARIVRGIIQLENYKGGK
ncbi:MAG: hypothetical protein ACPLXS_03190, partial [Candidatus Micrarchaeales archaeon]